MTSFEARAYLNHAKTMRAHALFAMMIFGLFGCADEPSWPSVKEMVRRDFPDVERVSTDELSRQMAADPKNVPILLDVPKNNFVIGNSNARIDDIPIAEILVIIFRESSKTNITEPIPIMNSHIHQNFFIVLLIL